MSALDRHERSAALLEALLADPLRRAAFQRSPARTFQDFDLPELAADPQTGAGGTLPLELRESRSGLAGAMIAMAVEVAGLVELAVGEGAQHGPGGGIGLPVERPGGVRSSAASVEPHTPPVASSERVAGGARPSAASVESRTLPVASSERVAGGVRPSAASVESHTPPVADSERVAGGVRSSAASVEPRTPPVADSERIADARGDEGSAAREAVARDGGHPAQSRGSHPSRSKIAAWMARRASAAGIPSELPIMAALAQSSLTDQPSDRQDAAGYFQISRKAWDLGPYRGFADDPDLQLDWFLDRAAVVRAEHVAAGDSDYGRDPGTWSRWVSAAVGRPDASNAGDGGGLDAAQRLLQTAQPGSGIGGERSAAAGRAVQVAERYLGQPYRWGGASPQTGFDCSGLVQYAYGQAGVTLPRVTDQQFAVGEAVRREDLRSGDIVFFRDATGYIHHEGLYLSDGRFLHAPHTGDVVKVSSLEEPYYAQQFAGGRRVGQLADAHGPESQR